MVHSALGPSWLDPQTLIEWFGPLAVLGVCLIVFVETGLLVGFFLPGDSLLFTAGLLVATGALDVPIWLLALSVGVAAFVGDQCGYVIGRTVGPRVFQREDGRFFKRAYVDRTSEFFEKYGARTIVLARFVPIVRTFAPVTAGVARMHYRTFVTYNIVGAVLWGVGVTLLGYWLGQFSFVADHIEVILIAIVGVSVLPVVIEILRARRSAPAADPLPNRSAPAPDRP